MGTHGLTQRLDRFAARLARKWRPQILVSAPGYGIDYGFGPSELPFHAASVGKLVTTALIVQSIEAGELLRTSTVGEILPSTLWEGLVTSGQATVEHLLTHTSGANDYFLGRTRGAKISDLALNKPEHVWTPEELLDYARRYQRPVGPPGEKYLYSDTGFVLLGLMLNSVTGQPFEALAHERIFTPLGMDSAFFPYRTQPRHGTQTLAPLWLDKTRVDQRAALSIDWAGGGVAACPLDFLLLIRALRDGTLVSPESWAWASRERHRFLGGLYSGSGVMTFRVEGFAPWLRGRPRLVGHVGVTAAHVWHEPDHGADIVLNLGSTRAMRPSVRALIEVVENLRRLG